MSVMPVLTLAVLVLAVLLAIAIYIIMRAANEILFLRDDISQIEGTTHAKCMSAVMAYVGNQWAAQVLEIAADDYASVESQPDKDRIGRLLWRQDGEPVPSIWLRERADRLRVESDWGIGPVADAAQINLNGVVL